jgi:aminodeoxyfutalosine deaminase
MAFSLQARVVFPVDRPPIEHGFVTIEDDRILAVGAKFDCGKAIDLGPVALLPGLVNAHTHLEFSYLRQPLGKQGVTLPEWIRLIIAERGRADISPLVSFVSGLQECGSCGVTSLCDIATDIPLVDGNLEITYAAEVIGFSRARAASSLSAVIERLNKLRELDAGFTVTIGHGVKFGISPHAPYTVSPDLLHQLVMLARERSLPLVMHLAESVEELEFLKSGTGPFQELLVERSMWDEEAVPRGSRPLDYLQTLADASRALVVHGNYLDDEELAFLGTNRKQMSLVYCPRTHAYFEHAPYPLEKALEAGVRIVLGTDSRASNPDLDLLAEMRYVARTRSSIDPNDVLRMGTLAGAEALGRSDEAGSITPGKLANLVAVPLGDDARGHPNDMLAAIFANDKSVSAVWLRGRSAGDDAGSHLERSS